MPATTRELRRAEQRFRTVTDWLTEYSSFSFGSHYDPTDTGFGALMAHNEDLIQPGFGFESHAHADTEIVTWMLSGVLVHEDSAGHRGIIYPGLVQRTSAGAGIVHSERNDGYRTLDGYRIDPPGVQNVAHYIQMWVQPDESGLEPSYAQQELDLQALYEDWMPVISRDHPDAVITLSASATLWATNMTPGTSRTLPGERGRQHLFVANGTCTVEEVGDLGPSDALRLSLPEPLRMTARTEATVLIWQLPGPRAEGVA